VTLGLQGELKAGQPLAPDRIVGSAKHFLADGGTDGGRDQGDATIPERDLISIHAAGYPPAIDAGVLTVMASFSSWNGQKLLANKGLLTDVLRGPLGFTGFTVGDWNAHGQVPGCSNESCPIAFNAGLDMFMAPDSWRGLYANTLAQVRSGEISRARLDEAVRRILLVKIKAGRPLWTNPEINASDAFVAAWLPGSEGGGVADVLLAGADGRPRFDFTGRLSYSWPKSAAQSPLNVGQPGYDPQFAYGFGLTYAKGAETPKLPEDPGVTLGTANPDRYLGPGGAIAPWSLNLIDEGGSTRATSASATSPRGAVAMRAVDATTQEGGRSFAFSREATVQIAGQPVDLVRQANGEMSIAFSVRTTAVPKGPVNLTFDGARIDIAPLLAAARPGAWTRHKIRLSCFAPRGADMRNVESPFGLAVGGPFEIAIADIRLASNEGDAICPQP
jgi:hypothetical protein